MTKEEAIEEIRRWTPLLLLSGYCFEGTSEAQDMAISALSESEGEWIRTAPWTHCSICGFAPYDEQDCGNFCPNCGAKMKGDKRKKERAIEILEHELKWGRNDDGVAGIHDGTTLDALEMAISALKDSKGKGKWIDSSNGWTCSICNRDSKSDTEFCPHCGAKMKGGN